MFCINYVNNALETLTTNILNNLGKVPNANCQIQIDHQENDLKCFDMISRYYVYLVPCLTLMFINCSYC